MLRNLPLLLAIGLGLAGLGGMLALGRPTYEYIVVPLVALPSNALTAPMPTPEAAIKATEPSLVDDTPPAGVVAASQPFVPVVQVRAVNTPTAQPTVDFATTVPRRTPAAPAVTPTPSVEPSEPQALPPAVAASLPGAVRSLGQPTATPTATPSPTPVASTPSAATPGAASANGSQQGLRRDNGNDNGNGNGNARVRSSENRPNGKAVGHSKKD